MPSNAENDDAEVFGLAPVIADYPELVAGYAGLGIDIVAEVEAAGLEDSASLKSGR